MEFVIVKSECIVFMAIVGIVLIIIGGVLASLLDEDKWFGSGPD